MVTVLQRWSLPLDVKIRAAKLKTVFSFGDWTNCLLLVSLSLHALLLIHIYISTLDSFDFYIYLLLQFSCMKFFCWNDLLGVVDELQLIFFKILNSAFLSHFKKERYFCQKVLLIIVSNLRFGILRFVFVIGKSLFTIDSNW